MTNPNDDGAIPHARVAVPTEQPQTLQVKERENAVISRLNEIAGEYGLTTIGADQRQFERDTVGKLEFADHEPGGSVTLFLTPILTSNRSQEALQLDAGQLFGILKLASKSSQLSRKREERAMDTLPKVSDMAMGITFASMDALEKAVHAVDPWANKWTGKDVAQGL